MNDLDLCLEVVSRSRQLLRYIWRWISRKPIEIEAWLQRTTNRKCHMSNGQVTDYVTWPPKVLWGSAFGYSSDSLASCILCNNKNVWLSAPKESGGLHTTRKGPTVLQYNQVARPVIRPCQAMPAPCCAVKTTWFHLYSITTVDLTGSYRFLRSVAPLSQCLTRRRAGLLV